MRQEMRKKLELLTDSKYKDFNCKLLPGVNREQVLGVRVPQIRKLAKESAKGDWRKLLSQLESCGTHSEGTCGTELYYEEIMLWGMIIGAAKMQAEERLAFIKEFLPRIDNWAVCDTFCGDLKFAGQEENRELVWEFLQPCLKDTEEYVIRFGIVMLLNYYIDEPHIDRVLSILEAIRHEGYYVKMAAAWALSMCYIRFPEKTEVLLQENRLDDFTHNKTIQKIRESYRVSKEDKERLKLLKR